jgi:hypothetical protein
LLRVQEVVEARAHEGADLKNTWNDELKDELK